MDKAKITSLNSQSFNYVDLDITFAMALAYMDGERRGMFPVRGASPEDMLPLGTNYHFHAHYEMIYVLDGTFTQHLENAKYCLNAGDATLLNRSIRHYEGSETKCTCIYVNMSQAFLNQLFQTNPISKTSRQHECKIISAFCSNDDAAQAEQRAALDFRRTISSGAGLSNAEIPRAQQLLDEISKTLISSEWGFAFTVQGLLLRLFAELENPSSYHITNVQTNSNPEEILFMEIQHYLKERNGRITRNELSELLHYHPDYLGRVVKRQSGMSYVQYSQQLWLDKAKALLCSSDMSVAEIIRYLAFENRHHFYRVFSAATGMTPQEYRSRNQTT